MCHEFVDHDVDFGDVLKLGLLGDLLTDRTGHSMTLTYRRAGAQNFTRCLLLMMR